MSLFLVSCHGDLDVLQKDGITTDSAWVDENDAESAMYGVCDLFRNAYAYDRIKWGEFRTGLWQGGIENIASDLDIFNNTVTAVTGSTGWAKLYKTINGANITLKHTQELEFRNEKMRHTVLGSMYFTRAFCYYWIARIWGDAPLVLDGYETDGPELYPSRTPVAELYARIEEDLKQASDHLKEVSVPSNRPNYLAVKTLQTDFYLWMYKVCKDGGALEKARKACDEVLGKKVLLDNYADIFDVNKELNDEIIFAWSFLKDEYTGGLAADWLVPLQYVSKEYRNNPVQIGSNQQWTFISDACMEILSETPGDTRKDATYKEFFDDKQGSTVHWITKYMGTWENGRRIFDSDAIAYRYADIVLFDAEIKNEQGRCDEAVAAINQIARRAYGKENFYPAGQSKEQIDEIIIKERTKEFCAEGKIWWDYIRFGVVFKKVPTLHGKEKSKNILLWPINQGALNKNHNLVQTEFETVMP